MACIIFDMYPFWQVLDATVHKKHDIYMFTYKINSSISILTFGKNQNCLIRFHFNPKWHFHSKKVKK